MRSSDSRAMAKMSVQDLVHRACRALAHRAWRALALRACGALGPRVCREVARSPCGLNLGHALDLAEECMLLAVCAFREA